ncbi:hypothetical protein LTR62_001901 [Meristemomyces frigidus]|uniref:Glycoside hydrolase family 43 protein n=1 Tax=Meristemomyces frigidus TaxID=1508187 RepID=A0AAN7T8W5_9PEZI|nr:hypothetical protein LTR62_001901 [Meristemomyces frigidus]
MLSCFLCALSTFAAFVLASPVPELHISVQTTRRSEAGSDIAGANFPDPSIIQVSGVWYAFATRTIGSSIHIQVARSDDFTTWSILKKADGTQFDALPNLPAWVDKSDPATWAPDVDQLADGSFMMYYSATAAADSTKHCIGAARSANVTGPYTPFGTTSLICPLSRGGAIDASGYAIGGHRYITWKIDGNSLGHGGACNNLVAPYVSSPIMIQQVQADGITFLGTATKIMDNDGPADQGVVEAPSLVQIGRTFVLFFSSGCFVSTYNQTYATSTSITGPYTRATKPLFYTGIDGLTNPGGGDIAADGKHLLFHANSPAGRSMFQAVVSLNGRKVSD